MSLLKMIVDVFTRNLTRLERLFGPSLVSQRKERLIEIFESTESSWVKNAARLKGRRIKTLLLAEAAPWSEQGTPRYFYNRIESSYHLRIWRAFFPKVTIPDDAETAFLMLAQHDFLLVDTIPFSMEYKGKRRHKDYFSILLNSLDWWMGKLNSNGLELADDIKVALAFRVHGQSLVNAINGRIPLHDGRVIDLNTRMIAADGSGYTNSDKLRVLYNL